MRRSLTFTVIGGRYHHHRVADAFQPLAIAYSLRCPFSSYIGMLSPCSCFSLLEGKGDMLG